MYPELVSHYDESGNAILNMGTSAADTTQKLEELIAAERLATHTEIASNLPDVIKGVRASADKYNDEIEEIQKTVDKYKALSNSIGG